MENLNKFVGMTLLLSSLHEEALFERHRPPHIPDEPVVEQPVLVIPIAATSGEAGCYSPRLHLLADELPPRWSESNIHVID